MTVDLAQVPLWAAIPAAFFLVLGGGLTLLGAIGLIRLKSFYERIHAPSLGTSWGAGGLIVASMLVFSTASGKPVLHDILIGIFLMITTPVTLMMLGRAALYRDRTAGRPGVPAMPAEPAADDPMRQHSEPAA